jgi:hypothetical protein
MRAFVASEAHQTAIREAYSALASARFANVEVPRSDVPLSWESALALLEGQAEGYATSDAAPVARTAGGA